MAPGSRREAASDSSSAPPGGGNGERRRSRVGLGMVVTARAHARVCPINELRPGGLRGVGAGMRRHCSALHACLSSSPSWPQRLRRPKHQSSSTRTAWPIRPRSVWPLHAIETSQHMGDTCSTSGDTGQPRQPGTEVVTKCGKRLIRGLCIEPLAELLVGSYDRATRRDGWARDQSTGQRGSRRAPRARAASAERARSPAA
jgi:hypothetical protein